MEFSKKFGLSPNVIEKDYVLGWLLAGIHNHKEISTEWVFKGGTCLKKCYFETYRFSEDLDFTIRRPEHLNEEYLTTSFQDIAMWVYENTGIEIPGNTIRFEVYRNPRGGISAQGKIAYRGPMQPGGDLPRIKLDLTIDEIIVLEPVIRKVHHPYSDGPEEGIHIQCSLPPFEQFWNELPEVFEWLYHAVEKVVAQSIPSAGMDIDETWHFTAMADTWHISAPLEIIQFSS